MKEIMDVINQDLKSLLISYSERYSGRDRVLPFVITEANFNSLVLASIYSYMNNKRDFDSFAVAEASVKRGKGNGRCDIIWYLNKHVYFIELKGFSWNIPDKTEKVIKYINDDFDKAFDQVVSIKPDINLSWHYEDYDPARWGCVIKPIVSVIYEGRDNHDELLALIRDDIECQKNKYKMLSEIKFKSIEKPLVGNKINEKKRQYDDKITSSGIILLGKIFRKNG